jgi:hypothetical protein
VCYLGLWLEGIKKFWIGEQEKIFILIVYVTLIGPSIKFYELGKKLNLKEKETKI